MAEKPKDKKPEEKKKEHKKHSRGEMSFGAEIILFIIALFILWALFGKPSENVNKPFVKDQNVSIPQ